MSEVTVIRAGIEHLDALVPLFEAYRVHYEADPDPERARTFLQDCLTNDEAVVFLAHLDGSAAGFTLIYPLLASIVMERVWLLNDLFVVPQARKHGVARALLDRARDFGIETGANRLQLSTEVENISAQRSYEGHGWRRVTQFYHYRLYL